MSEAVEVSADVELVRASLNDGGVYGVEGVGVPKKWAWRLGVVGQYERAPVLVVTEGEITSKPVSDRIGGWGGFSLGLGRRVAVQAVLPLDWQTGNDPDLSAEGAGIGDPRVGARWGMIDTQLVDATLRGDVYLPIGRRDAWLGEETFRAAVGASASLDGGFGALLVDVGLVARPLESPVPRFDWGPTGELAVGVRADISDNFTAGASWVARAVLAGLDQKDGELASELLASARYQVTPSVAVQAGGGAGLQEGAGVPTFRAFANVTFSGERQPPKPKPEPVAVKEPEEVKKILEEEIPGIDVPPPPPPPPAAVVGDEITFRGEINFKENSAELLPESIGTIRSIADLLAADGRIAHVAIEGHASEEGDLVYNWDLSDRRARSVWEALVLEGISPQRMSWRGLGEVAPVAEGSSEAAHAQNRRVVFRIARRLAKDETLPAGASTATLPWNGEAVALDAVSIPAEVVPAKEFVDPTFFDDPEEEE